MTKPSVRFSLGRYLILLAGIQFFFYGCAQLDGVFPKFKPQETTKKSTSTSSAETVTEQQEILTEENRLLKAKIEQLAQQISELQKQQKVQSDDFLLLQEQWETNFVLLERSVEESLRSAKASESTALMITQVLENQSLNSFADRSGTDSQGSLPPLENYSLLGKPETSVQKASAVATTKEMEKINNLEISEQQVCYPHDHVLDGMLQRMGLTPSEETITTSFVSVPNPARGLETSFATTMSSPSSSSLLRAAVASSSSVTPYSALNPTMKAPGACFRALSSTLGA